MTRRPGRRSAASAWSVPYRTRRTFAPGFPCRCARPPLPLPPAPRPAATQFHCKGFAIPRARFPDEATRLIGTCDSRLRPGTVKFCGLADVTPRQPACGWRPTVPASRNRAWCHPPRPPGRLPASPAAVAAAWNCAPPCAARGRRAPARARGATPLSLPARPWPAACHPRVPTRRGVPQNLRRLPPPSPGRAGAGVSRLQPSLDRLRRGQFFRFHRGFRGRGRLLQKFAQERGETQLLAKRGQFGDIQRRQLQLRQSSFHREHRCESWPARGSAALRAKVAQGIVVALLLDLFVILQRFLQRAKLLDQLRSSLGANVAALLRAFRQRRLVAGQGAGAGNVVTGVARERQPVHHLRGLNSDDLLHLVRIANRLSIAARPRRLQHTDVVVHQLKQVLVTGHDKDFRPLRGPGPRQRANHVVGFKAFQLHQRQSHGAAESLDVGKLQLQIVGEFRPVGLVFLKELVAERGRRQIERHGKVIGLMVLQQLPQRADEDVNGLGGHSAG